MHLEAVRGRLLQIWSPSQTPSAVLAEVHVCGDYYLLSNSNTAAINSPSKNIVRAFKTGYTSACNRSTYTGMAINTFYAFYCIFGDSCLKCFGWTSGKEVHPSHVFQCVKPLQTAFRQGHQGKAQCCSFLPAQTL